MGLDHELIMNANAAPNQKDVPFYSRKEFVRDKNIRLGNSDISEKDDGFAHRPEGSGNMTRREQPSLEVAELKKEIKELKSMLNKVIDDYTNQNKSLAAQMKKFAVSVEHRLEQVEKRGPSPADIKSGEKTLNQLHEEKPQQQAQLRQPEPKKKSSNEITMDRNGFTQEQIENTVSDIFNFSGGNKKY